MLDEGGKRFDSKEKRERGRSEESLTPTPWDAFSSLTNPLQSTNPTLSKMALARSK